MVEALLEHYNKHSEYKADKVITTALTFLDKQTATQLSNNFINGALIIDDGEKEEEKACIERWLTRDEDGALFLHIGKEQPIKGKYTWSDDLDNYIELDSSLFPEVQWSDAEPTNVKLIIDKN